MEFIKVIEQGIQVPTRNATLDLVYTGDGNITATMKSITDEQPFSTIETHSQEVGVILSKRGMWFHAWLRLSKQIQIEIPAESAIDLEKALSKMQLVEFYIEEAIKQVAPRNPNATSPCARNALFIFLRAILLQGESFAEAHQYVSNPMMEEVEEAFEELIHSNAIQFIF
ncbi:hypothetical protein ABH309_01035 [Chromobacterium piscinae]|uniref:Uncharacterized protein n=1 Tax=Chromobacterium piscinae TaxID=686831 RepID=A0ABV0GZ64_9NEIS